MAKRESVFLWGPRQSGKSTLLKALYPSAPYYDLLLSDQYARLTARPQTLREELLAAADGGSPVIIDEVQKVPALLDEIHWLMTNARRRFVLCGSSARKLRRSGAGLLGGRAVRYELFPLTSAEIEDFDLLRALNNGLLPRHYQAPDAGPLLQAYVGDYLKEEIAAEALTRDVPAFFRFLEAAALSNGELVAYANIASECGVSAPTVKSYFQILEDTLVGRTLPSYRKRPKRRVLQVPKFYFFDVGVANHLLKRGKIQRGGESFGRALEHLIYQELAAHSHYSGLGYPVSYWRTASQLEVDFILGDAQAAVEVKGTSMVTERQLSGLKAFREEYPAGRSFVVSDDPRPRRLGAVEVLPWREFLARLWSGEIIR